VLDVENLRLHYARTLEHWLERFERSKQQVAAMFDERFVRMWRLYLAGSAAAFHTGTMQLFQVIFAGSECKAIPWTRAHLYEAEPESTERLQSVPSPPYSVPRAR
ncbi:MAG TPA: class I SAM-dependent methyltransferase, partial [Terriglobales bacterium]